MRNKIQKWDAFIAVDPCFVVWQGKNRPNVMKIAGAGLVGRNKWVV